MITIGKKNYVTMKEATETLDLHRLTVAKLIKANKLKGFKVANRYLIPDGSIQDFIEKEEANACS